MNNKGFTLIELLAVVILLITISLFVMPKIVDVIKEGDKTKENITKNKIIEAAKEYTSNYDTNFLNDLVNVGDSKYIDKEELINNKLLDTKDIGDIPFIKVKVILKEDNKIEYIIVDSATVSRPNYGNAVDYINNLYDIEDFRKEDGLKKDNTSDANIRYEGANPNNYVKFNNELWRIIGVFDVDDGTGKVEKRMKIIRNESIGNYSWDYTSSGSYTNEWKTAQLNTLLNSGAYYNRTTGSYYNNSTSASNVDFTSTGLTDAAKSMIGDAKWYLGGASNYTSSSNGLASHFYSYERGTAVYNSSRSTNWTGKVGLMYPSDYGYATSGGNSRNRASCMAKELYSWDDSSYSDCKNNDWLLNTSTVQWTMSPRADNSYNVFYVNYAGFVDSCSAYYTNAGRPVVHLKSTIKVISGSGTTSSPFILG